VAEIRVVGGPAAGSFGHLMAAGAPRSGRSQLLRTIAVSIAVSASAADVHRDDAVGSGGQPRMS
jgi:DNA segregation ATPase FtsK/SpoIIIE-like protein